jgi:hypothetical protein
MAAVMHLFSDQDHSNAVSRWKLAPIGRADEYLRDRDLKQLATCRRQVNADPLSAVEG